MLFHAITIPGRTSDEDDGGMVWDSVSVQLERKSESKREISMRLPATADMDTPTEVIEDVTMVEDQ